MTALECKIGESIFITLSDDFDPNTPIGDLSTARELATCSAVRTRPERRSHFSDQADSSKNIAHCCGLYLRIFSSMLKRYSSCSFVVSSAIAAQWIISANRSPVTRLTCLISFFVRCLSSSALLKSVR